MAPVGRYVIMGVAGSGKSVVGAALADALGVTFVEGDLLHPRENISRMAAGIPLSDEDRHVWLAAIADRLRASVAEGAGLVVSCSALKRRYRAMLREAAPALHFVFLDGAPGLIASRLAEREAHFMPPSLLPSQFATLEPPGPDEGAWHVDVTHTVDEIVGALVARITAAAAPESG